MYYVFICEGGEYEQVLAKLKRSSSVSGLRWVLVNRQNEEVQFMELYESIVQAVDQQYQQHVGEITQQQISRREKLRQGQALF